MKTKSVTEKNMKVCLVGSSGGHLTHLYMLKPFWKDPLTGEMKKKQMKFFPDAYKDRIGKSYNDYIADHQIQALLEANGLAVGKDYQFKGRYDAMKNAVIISLEKDE